MSLFKKKLEYYTCTLSSSCSPSSAHTPGKTTIKSSGVIIAKHQRRQWQPTPVLLPGKCHGQRSLVGCSPWGHKKSDTTEWLHFHFSLSCIGEGNDNPLQCSCLENPRDGGLPSMGSHRVGHDWSDLAAAAALPSIDFKHLFYTHTHTHTHTHTRARADL